MSQVKEATEEYVNQQIASAMSGAMSGMFVVASSLPQAGEAGKIYLVPNNGGESGNVRDEYMWVNGAWELIGSTQVDLSGYYDKTAADGRFVQKETGKGLFSGSYNDLSDKPTIPEPVDISGKQDELSQSQLAAVNSGATAAKVAAWDGYAAQIAQKANSADLPYALVTPGEWKFSGSPEGATDVGLSWDGMLWIYTYVIGTETYVNPIIRPSTEPPYDGNELSLTFSIGSLTITATRASLPGHLLDRANNLIDATTGNVMLTLPAYQEGKVRDLLVACTIGLDTNDEPWSVIFQGQGSEAPEGANEISFKAEVDDAASATFPVPTAAGDWWYSLTERAPHVFAVSLKQLQSVSQSTQTQGGS